MAIELTTTHPAYTSFIVDAALDIELVTGEQVEEGSELEVHALVDGNELLESPERSLEVYSDGERVAVGPHLVGAVEEALSNWWHLN